MGKFTGTPGPWTTAEQDEPCIWSARGIVARLWCGRGDEAANAALIAASPELLEALQKLLAYNEDIIAGRINYRPEDHAQVARAAISRATQTEGK